MENFLENKFKISKILTKEIVVLLDDGLSENIDASNYGMDFDPLYDYQCLIDFKESFNPIVQEYGISVKYENDHKEFFKNIFNYKPEFVINLINYGFLGNEKSELIPSVLELLDIPFLNSGMIGMSLSTDKHIVHQLAKSEKIPTPEQIVLKTEDILNKKPIDFNFFPAFIKLRHGKCSCGITEGNLVNNVDELYNNFPYIHEKYLSQSNLNLEEWLLQEYLPGNEYNVSLIGNGDEIEVFPILQVKYENDLYKSFDLKYDTLSTEDDHLKDANLPLYQDEIIKNYAKNLFKLLECRDYCRMEFRCDNNGIPKIIDVNPHTPYGNHEAFTASAYLAGLDHILLRKTLLAIGLKRYKLAI